MNKVSAAKCCVAVSLLSAALLMLSACGKDFPALPESNPAPAEPVAAESAESLPETGDVEPEEEIPAEPEATPFVEPEAEFVHGVPEITGYDAGVCPGQVRYVSQLKDLRKNGWGRFEGRAGSECTTACISMALSCIGIDESPEKLLSYNSTTIFASSYGIKNLEPSQLTGAVPTAEKGYEIFTLMLENYLSNRDYTVSPVLLYLTGNGNRHGILVIGTEEDCFLVLDPASRGLHRISVSEKGEISSWEGKDYLARYTNTGKVKAKISALAQWSVVPEIEEKSPEQTDDKKSSP